jgi:AcrR family transcriptional regulator
MAVAERKTKDVRREEILDAALQEFAARGLHGASTEDIARLAGISQPYVFRLFGTKKELFRAVVARCFRETLEMFQRAAEGTRGEEALRAMGSAYVERYLTDRARLRAQMQAYAACDDDDIRVTVRQGFGDLVAYAERVSGLGPEAVTRFFATGMLLNVLASMELTGDASEPWADRLLEGCSKSG